MSKSSNFLAAIPSEMPANYSCSGELCVLSPYAGINTHSVVIMDNCSVHHLERITQMIHNTGALLKFLPSYSPDMNPIELVFSKAKAFIKANYIITHSTFDRIHGI